MYGYIYITTNLINNKKYIGQHKAKEFEPNKYIGSGKYFEKAVKKYGKENFKCELLEWCESLEKLNEKEVYWISYYNAVESKLFYNKTPGGLDGIGRVSCKSEDYTLEVRERMSKSLKGKPSPMKGKPSPLKGKHLNITPEGKRNKILKMKGKRHSEESNKKFAKKRKGIKYSKERNEKIRLTLNKRKKVWTQEEINKLISFNNLKKEELLKLFPNKNLYDIDEKRKELGLIKTYKQKIKCVELNKSFNSISEAKEWLGKGDIDNCLRGNQKTAGGYHWEYVK